MPCRALPCQATPSLAAPCRAKPRQATPSRAPPGPALPCHALSVAKIMKGKLAIPNPKERPILEPEWKLKFVLTLQETPELNETLLKKIFEIGGNAVGIGTFRGVFGKFKVETWE